MRCIVNPAIGNTGLGLMVQTYNLWMDNRGPDAGSEREIIIFDYLGDSEYVIIPYHI